VTTYLFASQKQMNEPPRDSGRGSSPFSMLVNNPQHLPSLSSGAHPALDKTALRNVQIGMYNISSARTATHLNLEISMSKGLFDAELSAVYGSDRPGVFRERTLPAGSHSYVHRGQRDRRFRRSLVQHLSSFGACLPCRLPSSVQPQLFLFSDFRALSSEVMGVDQKHS